MQGYEMDLAEKEDRSYERIGYEEIDKELKQKRMQSVAIDFDGVIHKYSKGWQDGTCYDEAVELVFEAIQELMKDYNVFIFSTRKPKQIRNWLLPRIMEQGFGDNPHDPQEWEVGKYGFTCQIIPFWIKFWNKRNVLGITRRKLPAMVYIDDRALRFDGDWTEITDKVRSFKTYMDRR